jgi:hypothetical protein
MFAYGGPPVRVSSPVRGNLGGVTDLPGLPEEGNLPRQPDVGTEQQRRWREDTQVLAQVGRALEDIPMPVVEVRIPRDLADKAAAAWAREDAGALPYETAEQRADRRRAGVLALIGLAIEKRGRRETEAVVVDLSADLVVAAVEAADDVTIGS